jgi:hypothetical protein
MLILYAVLAKNLFCLFELMFVVVSTPGDCCVGGCYLLYCSFVFLYSRLYIVWTNDIGGRIWIVM